jgi:hypothetical protein
MALLDFFMGIQDPVEGEYLVTSVSKSSGSSSVGSCDMVGEVSAAGFTARSVEHNSPFTSLTKWPRPGDVLPVLFDRTNPEFLKVQWKQVPDRA